MAAAPHADDVKVAGDPFATPPADAFGAPPPGPGDTAAFGTFPAEPPHFGAAGPAGPPGIEPPGTGGPSDFGGPSESLDEIAGGPRRQGGPGRPQGPRRVGGSRRAPGGGRARRGGAKIAIVAAGAVVVVGGGAVTAFALTGDSGEGKDGKATVRSAPLADAAAPPQVDPKVLEAERRKMALDRASRAVRGKPVEKLKLRPKGTPIPTKKPEPEGGSGGVPAGDPVPAGEAQQIAKAMLPSFGFDGDGQFGCLVKLWDKESGWRSNAANPSSGAYGIPQALPGSKMSSAGSDWRTSARTQIKWGLGYIKNRYGSPCDAWGHSQSVGWY